MLSCVKFLPHIKPNWQVWYKCVLPEDRQHAEKVIRDLTSAIASPFKLEFRICIKDGIRHIRALAQPGTE
ncbi:PAS domain-containing protein [Escherichia coli]